MKNLVKGIFFLVTTCIIVVVGITVPLVKSEAKIIVSDDPIRGSRILFSKAEIEKVIEFNLTKDRVEEAADILTEPCSWRILGYTRNQSNKIASWVSQNKGILARRLTIVCVYDTGLIVFYRDNDFESISLNNMKYPSS